MALIFVEIMLKFVVLKNPSACFRHGGGIGAHAPLDPHGACGHPSILSGHAALLNFVIIVSLQITFSLQITIPADHFPADVSADNLFAPRFCR